MDSNEKPIPTPDPTRGAPLQPPFQQVFEAALSEVTLPLTEADLALPETSLQDAKTFPGDVFHDYHGLSYRLGAGTNRTSLNQLMWKSTKNWHRFGSGWVTPVARHLVPGWIPSPKPTKNDYLYTVPVANPQDLQFILMGDTGINSPEQLLVTSAVSRSDLFSSDFLLLLGDVIYPAGGACDYEYGLLEAFRHYQKPILAVPGNHDWYDRLQAYEQFFLTGNTPKEAANWPCPYLPNWYYHVDIGDKLRLICLDTGLSGKLAENRTAQLAWLDRVLASSEDRFLVVLMHHPLYSLSRRQHETSLRNRLEERFRRYGVRAVFAGHDHNYQRHEVDGIVHVIAGGGGATLHPLPQRRVIHRGARQTVHLSRPKGCQGDTHHSFIHCHWVEDALHCKVWSAHSLPPDEGILLDSFVIR